MAPAIRRLAGATVTVGLVLAGLYAGYLWLFHSWAASSGSDTGLVAVQRAWHRMWSVRFFWAMAVCFALAASWVLRRYWWRCARPGA